MALDQDTQRNVNAGLHNAPIAEKVKNDESRNNPEDVIARRTGDVVGGVSYAFDYSKIKDVDYFIEFTAYQYERGRQDGKGARPKQAIFRLPLMSGVNMSYNMNYSDADIQLFADAVLKSADAAINGVQGKTEQMIEDAASAFSGAKGAVAQQALNYATAGGEYRAIAANTLGVTKNPRTEATFVGIGMRSHAFAFLLVPRNRDERDMIRDIIKAIKLLQHPRTFKTEAIDLSDAFLEFPVEWTIAFYSKDGEPLDIPPIPDSFLQSFSVGYNANGAPIFFDDGTATSYRLDLGFVEANQLTQDDIRSGGY
jgi:hypothetical protein